MEFKRFVELIRENHHLLFLPCPLPGCSDYYEPSPSRKFETLAVFIFFHFPEVCAVDKDLFDSIDSWGTDSLWSRFDKLLKFYPDREMSASDREYYNLFLDSDFGLRLLQLSQTDSETASTADSAVLVETFLHMGFKSFDLSLSDAYRPAYYLNDYCSEFFIRAIDSLHDDFEYPESHSRFSSFRLNKLSGLGDLKFEKSISWPFLYEYLLRTSDDQEIYAFIDRNRHSSDSIHFHAPDKSFDSFIVVEDWGETMSLYLYPKCNGLSIYRFSVLKEKFKLCLLYIYIYFSSDMVNKRENFILKGIFDQLGVTRFQRLESVRKKSSDYIFWTPPSYF